MSASLTIGRERRSILPGFGIAFGFTVVYLSLIVLIPLGGLVIKAAGLGPADFWRVATDERTVAALLLSFRTAAIAGALNAVFGLLAAWVLVRYDFPGRRFFDAIIDLPFALPTAVAGIALTTLFAPNSWLGQWLAQYDIQVAFTPTGIVIALTFIGLPFVVRTVQPVLQEMDKELEEAAATLGATRVQTLVRVMFPSLLPATLTGFALAFARAVGEYGSVIFIAGNIPYVSEIAPLLIIIKLEEFDYGGASVIAVTMLAISFAILFVINLLQAYVRKALGHA